MGRRHAFTLVELLVVVGIIALLVTILMPSLGKALELTRTAKCLANLRNMEMAHLVYASANDGATIRAGLSHGGAHGNEEVAWINTLQDYYGDQLMAKCPSDKSPHWPGGEPVDGTDDQFRRCSYGINEFTDVVLCPWGGPYEDIHAFPRPSDTVHFVEMAETGEYAGADHPHVDSWRGHAPVKASKQLQINRHGGEINTWTAKANYGFLDGHAETLRFEEVFQSMETNRFNPAVAR